MKILMLVGSDYPSDIRVRQEALKLRDRGHKVSVIAIKEKNEKYFEIINGVKVYRVLKIELFKYGKHSLVTGNLSFRKLVTLAKAITGYGFEFIYFTAACFILSSGIFLRDRFDVIHTHNPPDTLFCVALFWKVFRCKFVYDHHDLCPDLFLEKYGSKGRIVYKMLLVLEKQSCNTADVIIATNESYKRIEIERCGANPEKIFVVRNGPNLSEMKIAMPIQRVRSKAKTILCYLGAVNIQDGLDNLIDVLARIVFNYNYKDICLMVIGDGDYLYKIKELVKEMNLNDYVLFTGYIADRNELNRYLSTADIFVDAAPKTFLNDNSTFIKHMEYMIYGKPVVSFALKESIYSLGDAGVFVKPNDAGKMAKAILNLAQNEKRKKDLGAKGKKRVKELSWDKVSRPLIGAYIRLKYIKTY